MNSMDISSSRRASAMRKSNLNTSSTTEKNNVRFLRNSDDIPDISLSNPIRGNEDYSLPSISIRNRMTGGVGGINTTYNNNRSSTNLETMRRVILLGDQSVGKTSLVKRIVVS